MCMFNLSLRFSSRSSVRSPCWRLRAPYPRRRRSAWEAVAARGSSRTESAPRGSGCWGLVSCGFGFCGGMILTRSVGVGEGRAGSELGEVRGELESDPCEEGMRCSRSTESGATSFGTASGGAGTRFLLIPARALAPGNESTLLSSVGKEIASCGGSDEAIYLACLGPWA